jgi:multidrug efflux system membrane fusion protein
MSAIESHPEASIQNRSAAVSSAYGSAGGGASTPPAGSNVGGTMRKVGLVVILAAAAGGAYWKIQANKKELADAANKTSQQANRAIPVTIATVASRTMPIFLNALGTVTAYNTVTIKSRVDGQLLTVNVREGQQVRRGQILATIDASPYRAAQAQAEGQLAKDQATADYAKAEAGRYAALYQAGVVSKDQQQVQQTSAGQSVGVLDADRAAIQAAKVSVAYTRIVSPIDGVVGLRQVDAGNIVHASDANGLIVVTQLQPITVIFTLPEDQLPTVIKTMRAGRKLVVDAYDRANATKLATGTLLTLDNQIDTTTGTVKAKAVFDNKDSALFSNQFVNVRLILEQRQNSLVVPSSALQNGSNGPYVYLLKAGSPPPQPGEENDGGAPVGKGAHSGQGSNAGSAPDTSASAGPRQDPFYVDVQDVVVDLTEGTQIILKSGLNAGDRVVVDGQEKLKRFSKVSPREAPVARRMGTPAETPAAGPTPAGSPARPAGGAAGGRHKPGQPAGAPQ